MADSDFISDPWVKRYLPVTNRDENGRTPAVQAVEDRGDRSETEEGFKTWVSFSGRAEQGLQDAFRDT